MPGIFYRGANRRTFLKTLSAVAFATSMKPFGADDSTNGSVRIALISDVHLAADPQNEHRKFRPAENLKRIVPDILKTQPKATILNGDAARLTGELDDYRALKAGLQELAAESPIFIGMGNHDNRENFAGVFNESVQQRQKVRDRHVLILDLAPARLIILDSLLYPNKTPGFLGKTQRTWLGEYLKSSDAKSTVLFVHHTLGDNDGELLDAERLFEVVEPHSKVKAIIYGHSHEYSFKRRGRLHLVNLPAVGYNFADKEPVGWVDSSFHPKGVSFTLHAIGGNMANDGKTTSLDWNENG